MLNLDALNGRLSLRRSGSFGPAVGLLVAIVLCDVGTSRAGQLTGQLKTPADFAPAPPLEAQVYWLIPNQVLPIAPPLVDPRQYMVIELNSSEGHGPAHPTPATFVLEDARVNPPVVAVRPGTRVRFINKDPTLHLFESVGSKFMTAQSVSQGEAFSHTFTKPGTYRLRCSEVPHMLATVVVSDAQYLVTPNSRGAFEITDIAPGSYSLRVWHRDRWIHKQTLTVGSRTTVEIDLSRISKD